MQAKLDLLAPAVEYIASLDPNGTSTRPYVYGYDEQPTSCEPNIRKVRSRDACMHAAHVSSPCEPNIRQLFGAVKAKWPHVATADAVAWRAAGKLLFMYHCIVRGARCSTVRRRRR